MSQSFAEALGWVIKSPHLVASLDRALNYAFQQQHRHVTLDHLLLALSEDSDALLVLRASKVDIEQLRNAISDLVGRNEDRAAATDQAGPTASSELITIFEYASAAADQSGRAVIDGAIVLAALIGEGNSPAARLLQAHGLTFDHAISSLQNRGAVPAAEPAAEPEGANPEDFDFLDQVESQPVTSDELVTEVENLPPEPAAPRAPVKDSSMLVRPVSDNAKLATPVAAPPIDLQPIPRDIPPSFGAGTQPVTQPVTQAPPQIPPQTPPQAPPQAPPQPAPASATPRRGINENTGSAGPIPSGPIPAGPTPGLPRQGINPNTGAPVAPPQFDRRIGAGEQGSVAGNPMAPPLQPPPPMPPMEDGIIAPWPDPETAAPPPPARGQYPPQLSPQTQPYPPYQPPMPGPADINSRGAPSPTSANGRAPAQAGHGAARNPAQSEQVDEGQLIENIPRRMRIAIPEQIEVRIARNSVDVPTGNMQGRGAPQPHEIYVTKAMTVRLRAPEGGVRIETSSPETQWIDNALGLIQDDYASWRWTVTPERRGVTKLQLVVSARTVGTDGVAAETALPDQVFDVVVRINYVLAAKQVGGWVTAMAAGGVIAAFGEDSFNKILELVNLI